MKFWHGKPEATDDRDVDDGFGNIAIKCNREDCDLQVVRPGKFQCKGDRDDTCGEWDD